MLEFSVFTQQRQKFKVFKKERHIQFDTVYQKFEVKIKL